MTVGELMDALMQCDRELEVMMPDGLPIVSVSSSDGVVYLCDEGPEVEE